MLQNITNWFEAHLQPCIYKQIIGTECPGCGFQRALIALLRGDLWKSIQLFPALIPMLFLFVFLALHLVFNFSKGATVLKYVFIGDIGIIIIDYIIRFTH
ncbi:MAG: DUF2752 domain-containing protein [Bacteroidales bacterium]